MEKFHLLHSEEGETPAPQSFSFAPPVPRTSSIRSPHLQEHKRSRKRARQNEQQAKAAAPFFSAKRYHGDVLSAPSSPTTTRFLHQTHLFQEESEQGIPPPSKQLHAQAPRLDIHDDFTTTSVPEEGHGEQSSYSNVGFVLDYPPTTNDDVWLDALLSSSSIFHEELPTISMLHSSSPPCGNQTTCKAAAGGVMAGEHATDAHAGSLSIPCLVPDKVSEFGDNDDDDRHQVVVEDHVLNDDEDHGSSRIMMIEPFLKNRCHHSIENYEESLLPTIPPIGGIADHVSNSGGATSFLVVDSEGDEERRRRSMKNLSSHHESPSTTALLTTEELERIAIWQLFVSTEQTRLPM